MKMWKNVMAPWTEEQVAYLRSWQSSEVVHPYTCSNSHLHGEMVLTPTTDGWECPVCDYKSGVCRMPDEQPLRHVAQTVEEAIRRRG